MKSLVSYLITAIKEQAIPEMESVWEVLVDGDYDKHI